jgi:predicted nucleic acid-binding protein
VIVVDESILATALGDDAADGAAARARLRAEKLDVPLLTADRRLARAPGLRCRVEVRS